VSPFSEVRSHGDLSDIPAGTAEDEVHGEVADPAGSGLAPYDGVLLVSFGGPEGPDDVMPFLENVTRGRGVPAERLAEVAEHYYARGGVSPINDANRALLAALRAELAGRGLDLPVVWGNRNWRPLLPDALAEAYQGGARRVLAVLTSAYSSWSGCRQYRENIAAAVAQLAERGQRIAVDVVRPYFDRPLLHDAIAEAVLAGLDQLEGGIDPADSTARVVFVTHSIPQSMDDASGPTGSAYSSQHRAVADAVMDRVARRRHRRYGWDLVFCSRSGSPRSPWLEPDVNDHLVELARTGAGGVVVVPIGFVSDHMEVVHDLDTEAASFADRLGLAFVRVRTVGTDPRFARTLVDALLARAAQTRDGTPSPPGSCCGEGCCRS